MAKLPKAEKLDLAPGVVKWSGAANGLYVEHATDRDEQLYVRGVSNGKTAGVELVNSDGIKRAGEYRHF